MPEANRHSRRVTSPNRFPSPRSTALKVGIVFAIMMLAASCNGLADSPPRNDSQDQRSDVDSGESALQSRFGPPRETPDIPVSATGRGIADGPTRYGGVLILANRGDPAAGFDSMRSSDIGLHHVGGSLFGGGNLVKRCSENVYLICPELARSWTASPGLEEWTFTIRDGVRWHDGAPFNAEDAKFWLDLAAFGATRNDPSAGLFQGRTGGH